MHIGRPGGIGVSERNISRMSVCVRVCVTGIDFPRARTLFGGVAHANATIIPFVVNEMDVPVPTKMHPHI